MEQILKYPRRKTRKIGDKSYSIAEPSRERSYTMQSIPTSNTSIEQIIEGELLSLQVNYCRHDDVIGSLLGKPDFLVPKYKIAIFCDGDYWHGRNKDKTKIKSNTEFWDAKFTRNINRDKQVNDELESKGWKVFRFWESDIKQDVHSLLGPLKTYILNQNKNRSSFTFVDLFSGVGGFRYALENLGGKCLGFSEIDKNAIDTYKKNFIDINNSDEKELGDITKIEKLPFDVDLIVGGVPCQSWSIAGKMKGFDDPRGKLWVDVLRLVNNSKPKSFIFENVKGLADPRNRENLELIVNEFEKIGYVVTYKVINSYDFGVPQNRERIYIVGLKASISEGKEFKFPMPTDDGHKLYQFIDDIKLDADISKKKMAPEDIFQGGKIPASRNRFQKSDELNDFFIFSDTRNGHSTVHSWDLIRTSKRDKEICMLILKNRRKKIYGSSDGNPIPLRSLKALDKKITKDELSRLVDKGILRFVKKIGYEFVNSKNSSGINGIYRVFLPRSNIFSTLTATGTRDYLALKNISGDTPEQYKENFIKEVMKASKYRKITGKDGGKLQGFPNNMQIPKEDRIALKQFGNAVSVPVVKAVGSALVETRIFDSNISQRVKYG